MLRLGGPPLHKDVALGRDPRPLTIGRGPRCMPRGLGRALFLAAGVPLALRPRPLMGKKSKTEAAAKRQVTLEDFAGAAQKQLSQKQRLIRAFDVGGTGVKTGLFSAPSLQSLLEKSLAGDAGEELEWIEAPTQLGQAPGEEGFDAWLLQALPRLQGEKANSNVVFGVSTAGDIEHGTGILHDWWSAGGHPRQWQIIPQPQLACFSVGTGVGFGISDEEGAILDPFTSTGARSHHLSGAPVSGASYRGVWRNWVTDTDHVEAVEKVMSKEFAGMARPWNMSWVSLVLGRRGMELAEAAYGCPPPERDEDEGRLSNADARKAATGAYAQQWAHFLQTQFVPQFCSASRRYKAERICFAGLVAETNWAAMSEALVCPSSNELVLPSAPAEADSGYKRGRSKKAAAPTAKLSVLTLAPHGSGLIGAGLYALAGLGGAEMGIWARKRWHGCSDFWQFQLQYQLGRISVPKVSKKQNFGPGLSLTSPGGLQVLVVGAKKIGTFGNQGTAAHANMRHLDTLQAAKAELSSRGVRICGIEIDESARPVTEHPFTGSTAFMLGNEGEGMSAAQREACDFFVYIPQFTGATASLNVAIAGSIVLHHFATWAGMQEHPRLGEKFVVDPARSSLDKFQNPTEAEREEMERKRTERRKRKECEEDLAADDDG
ncbi:unnamed protein product [Effrenium voratum]|uniref:tRNA/rRNA methyltransferase SpoU type domain-containing protein n=1 Tax=Effrenium voratum TaxID=2562239 RepID=A0AA36ISN1_9DINO|nr:unnamed protein product [Effrenium voratum]